MSTREFVLGETLDLLRTLWSVYHGLQKTSKRMSREVGITGSERITIRLLGRFPGIAAGSLADLLHVDPSTLTAVLKRLERRRLIERKRDDRDGRRVLLRLTKAGAAYDVETSGTAEAAVARAIRGLSARQLETTREVLLAVASELDAPRETSDHPRGRARKARHSNAGRTR